jgi:hypothetical protein
MEHVWREAAMTALLAEHDNCSLFVAGCASNQGRFYNCLAVQSPCGPDKGCQVLDKGI